MFHDVVLDGGHVDDVRQLLLLRVLLSNLLVVRQLLHYDFLLASMLESLGSQVDFLHLLVVELGLFHPKHVFVGLVSLECLHGLLTSDGLVVEFLLELSDGFVVVFFVVLQDHVLFVFFGHQQVVFVQFLLLEVLHLLVDFPTPFELVELLQLLFFCLFESESFNIHLRIEFEHVLDLPVHYILVVLGGRMEPLVDAL